MVAESCPDRTGPGPLTLAGLKLILNVWPLWLFPRISAAGQVSRPSRSLTVMSTASSLRKWRSIEVFFAGSEMVRSDVGLGRSCWLQMEDGLEEARRQGGQMLVACGWGGRDLGGGWV